MVLSIVAGVCCRLFVGGIIFWSFFAEITHHLATILCQQALLCSLPPAQGSADSISGIFQRQKVLWAPRCSLSFVIFLLQGTKLSIKLGRGKFSPFQELMMQGSQTIYSSINPFFFQLNFRVHRIGIIKAMCSRTFTHE